MLYKFDGVKFIIHVLRKLMVVTITKNIFKNRYGNLWKIKRDRCGHFEKFEGKILPPKRLTVKKLKPRRFIR